MSMKCETKFDIGQECYAVIGKDIEQVKIEKVVVTLGKSEDDSFTLYSITDSLGYACRLPEEQIFKTKEQAIYHITHQHEGKGE